MKKEVVSAFFLICFIGMVSAASFSLAEFFEEIGYSNIFLIAMFFIFFIFILISFSRFFKDKFGHPQTGLITPLAIAIALLLTVGCSQMNIDNSSLGISDDTLTTYLPSLIGIILILIIWKLKFGGLFTILGAFFLYVSIFTDWVYERGILGVIGTILLIIGLWLLKRRHKKNKEKEYLEQHGYLPLKKPSKIGNLFGKGVKATGRGLWSGGKYAGKNLVKGTKYAGKGLYQGHKDFKDARQQKKFNEKLKKAEEYRREQEKQRQEAIKQQKQTKEERLRQQAEKLREQNQEKNTQARNKATKALQETAKEIQKTTQKKVTKAQTSKDMIEVAEYLKRKALPTVNPNNYPPEVRQLATQISQYLINYKDQISRRAEEMKQIEYKQPKLLTTGKQKINYKRGLRETNPTQYEAIKNKRIKDYLLKARQKALKKLNGKTKEADQAVKNLKTRERQLQSAVQKGEHPTKIQKLQQAYDESYQKAKATEDPYQRAVLRLAEIDKKLKQLSR